jgi:hypothetical protein
MDGMTAQLEVAVSTEGTSRLALPLAPMPATQNHIPTALVPCRVASCNQPNGNHHALDAPEAHATSHQSSLTALYTAQTTLKAVFLCTALAGWVGALGTEPETHNLQILCNRENQS